MGQAMPKGAKSKKQKARFKDDDSKLNADMGGWSDVTRQDPWGPSHDKSGWQPAGNAGWGTTPTQEAGWTGWGRSDSRDAGGSAWGNDTNSGPWGKKPATGGRGDIDLSRNGWGHGGDHQAWSEDEEEEEEEEEEDGDSGWGGDTPHWTTTLQDAGDGSRSHWTKWGRTEGGPPPIPPSAIKRSHSTPQPSAKPQSAQKHPYQDHAETLNHLLSSSTHRHTPSHKSRPTSTRSQPKPLPHTPSRTQWPNVWAAPSSRSSDGLSYADDEPPPAPPVRHHGLSPQEDYFAPKSPYTPVSPSRTFAAALGMPNPAHFASPYGKDPQAHRFITSDGVALSSAHKALYSKTRRAQDRLHWAYNPDNDERVKSALWWVHIMSDGVGGLGLQKFLETHQRGALFVNADYAPPKSPHEPAFDWVTIDQLKDTLDKILQESVALYDPAKQVVVFIFLLSKSGNSMAIWRRKLPVPEILQTAYKGPIAETKAKLQPNYPVYVEEVPQRMPQHEQPRDIGPPPRRVLSKRQKSAGTVAATTPITPTMEAPLPIAPKKKKWWKPWSSKSRSKATARKQ